MTFYTSYTLHLLSMPGWMEFSLVAVGVGLGTPGHLKNAEIAMFFGRCSNRLDFLQNRHFFGGENPHGACFFDDGNPSKTWNVGPMELICWGGLASMYPKRKVEPFGIHSPHRYWSPHIIVFQIWSVFFEGKVGFGGMSRFARNFCWSKALYTID